ncbi:hypothetical protein [Clostridium kluyveri]|uniref:hypothetical protein n=1 Tax=Clostridium kluyveri TaxID=1534 RepID=UPI0022460F89|nr:hypothetical protein [Clostridium kluyveri]UZQ48849.1 hypothetical protein OP486_12745 [Clostridium kluyveri]
MNIEFMFNNIRDIGLIYSKEEKYDENWGDNIAEVHYLGTDYCRGIVMQLKSHFPEIKGFSYNGQTIRIAHEEYDIETMEEKYSLSFTIDTFEEKTQAQLLIKLFSSSDIGKYDIFLEKFKIFIKEILLRDWKMCTWIIDEQSEYLGMELYPLIFKTENKMRAFINKVLTYKFGVKWMELIGLEDIIKGYKRSNVDFKREVPEFNNINDFLICSTAESLAQLMLKSKIFETSFDLSDAESVNLHKMLADKKSNSVFEELLKLRKVKIDIWRDVFKKYFDNIIEKSITNFIKNRNHVAHNKLLTNASFEKMKQNILSVEVMFDKANVLFLDEEPSDELYETWNAEQEEILNEKEYIYDRIKNETGINILFSEGIFELFEEKIQELYTAIDDSEYFSYAVVISPLNSIQDEPIKQTIFSVESNVDNSFNFDVCVLLDITEGMDEDSYMNLWIEKSDMTKMLETKVMYHNGEAHEDTLECYYIPDSESYFENGVLKSFIDDLKSYISDDMNTIKAEANNLSYLAVKDGGSSPVADFPCWNCNQNYISIDNDLYTYGHCINCGEENEILKCIRCDTLYYAEDGGKDLCNYCLEKIEKE